MSSPPRDDTADEKPGSLPTTTWAPSKATGPATRQQGNRNVPALDEQGLPRDQGKICEDVLGANTDRSQGIARVGRGGPGLHQARS